MIVERIAKRLIGGNELRRKTVIGTDGDPVDFVEVEAGCAIDRWLELFSKAAITLGRIVILRDGRTNPKRIRHELVHVDQWEKYGSWFVVVYLFRWKKFESVAEAAEIKRKDEVTK